MIIKKSILKSTVLLLAVFITLTTGQIKHRTTDIKIGELKVRMLQDAQMFLPVSIIQGIEKEEAVKLNEGIDSAWTPVNSVLIQSPKHKILVDVGIGKYPGEDTGYLPEQLKEAGLEMSQIDMIFLTHFHFDHMSGLVNQEGKALFPNAVVYASKAENDFWSQDTSALPAQLRKRAVMIKNILAPYVTANKYKVLAPGESPVDFIEPIQAEGHTPGHTVYMVKSKGKELLCAGDIIHFNKVQFNKPLAYVVFDSDSKAAIKSRTDNFDNATKKKIPVAASHLPEIITITKEEDVYKTRSVEVKK